MLLIAVLLALVAACATAGKSINSTHLQLTCVRQDSKKSEL